jgi:predicted transcriptional regulator
MSGRKWTREENMVIAKCAKFGESSIEIADRLEGRTPTAVRKHAEIRGITLAKGDWKIDPVARASMLDELIRSPGCTLAEVARILGKTRHTVRAMAHHLVKEKLLERYGGSTNRCRYLVTKKWFEGEKGDGSDFRYKEYRIAAMSAMPQYVHEAQEISSTEILLSCVRENSIGQDYQSETTYQTIGVTMQYEPKPWTDRHIASLHAMRRFEQTADYGAQDKPLIKRLNKAIGYLEKRAKENRKARRAAIAIEQAVQQN